MLKGFMSFLGDYLDEAGSTGLVRAALGILAFAGVLSAAFGSGAFKAAALAIGALVTLSLLIVLTKKNTELRHEVASGKDLMTSHGQWLFDHSTHLWRINHWEEDITISANGDASGTIVVKVLVEAEDLPLFRLRFGPNWNQPEKYRHRVKATVDPGEGGAEWKRTLNWVDRNRLEILIHLGAAPPKKGDELTFRVTFTWPGKAIPLMRHGEPDEYFMDMSRPLAHLSYKITLPAGSRVGCSPFGLPKSAENYEFSRPTDKQPVVRLVARDIDADHRIGVRLDLK
jgi:hypothetical protein